MKKEYKAPSLDICRITLGKDILLNSDPEVIATGGHDNFDDSDPFDF